MKYFFHYDAEKYKRRLKAAMILIIMPIIAVCTFCTVNIVLNFGSEIMVLFLAIIGGSVLLGMISAFIAVYITERLSRRHSKYTFFDFLPKGMVYSEYAGEFTRYDDKIILRRLYYIPFESFKGAVRDAKISPKSITLSGEIRRYYTRTERLGYHITEDGDLVFDCLILNENYFETLDKLVIKDRLGNTKQLEKSCNFYWEQFKNIPEKKPFDISEHVAVAKRKKLHTSNAALEEPTISYNRNWK